MDVDNVYLSSASELIRHFWDAFPPTTPELAEKARKMFETLNKFQQMKVIINYNYNNDHDNDHDNEIIMLMVKVRPFEKEVERKYTPGGGHITQHINKMLESAYIKYNAWANKKR